MKKVLLFLFILILNSPNLFSQTNLNTSNISSNDAIVIWDNGGCSAGSYILRYREDGAAWNQNSPITIPNTGGSQSYNLNNLTSNTTYNWRIKCGSGGSWVNGPDFSTTGNFNLIGSIGNSSYYVYDDTTTWTEANNLCLNAGGNLVSVNSQQESDDLNTLLGNSSSPPFGPNAHWIGLIDGNNTWENGDPLNYTNYDASYNFSSGDYMYIQSNGFWDNSPNDGSQANNGIYPLMEISSGCVSSLSQTISTFSPNPVTGYMQNSEGSLTLDNTGTCDLNIRPQFVISHSNSPINQTDIVIEWENILLGGWRNIPYDVDNNGNAYGYWSPTSNTIHDSTGYEFQAGSATQTIPVRVRFMNPNNSPPNGAPYGVYSAAWTTYEVDTLGNIVQVLSNTDTIEISFVDCSTFSIDTVISNNATCFGGNDGNGIVVVSAGSGNYDYLWSNGQTSENVGGLSTGTYTVTVTDLTTGCTAVDSITINQPLQISATYTSNNILCNGGSDGAISITATNGSGTYDYNWTSHPSLNGSSNSNLSEDTYVIDVIDLNCSDVYPLSISITDPDPLSIDSIFFSDNTSCDSLICNGTFGIIVSGETPPYTYTWNPIGNTSSSANNLCAGTYSISVIDQNNCNSLFDVKTIIDNPFIPTLCLSLLNDVSCNGGSDGSVLATIVSGSCSGGTSNLTYCNSNAGDPNAPYSNIELVSLVGDNGANINNNTSGLCDLYEDYTSLSATLTPGQNYTLYVNTGTCSPGQYQIDSVGVFIDWNQDGDFDDVNEKIETFGGTQSPVYGIIPITVPTNATGGATRMRIVSQAQIGNASFPDNPVDACAVGDFGQTGSWNQPWYGATEDYTINISGSSLPGTYLWSNGVTDSLNTSLSQGVQTCTITDLNNCTATESITINQPNAINFTTSSTNVSCNGGNNGTAEIVNISGGTGPYSTNWFGADTNNLSAGTYSYTITDNNGCIDSGSVVITEPQQAISTNSSTTDVLCFDGDDGTASLAISGGTYPYIINWFGADTNNLSAGTYTYLVTDDNGCTDSGSVFIDEPTELVTTDSSTNVSCYGGNDASVTLYVSGGSPSYTLTAFGNTYQLLGTSYSHPIGIAAGNYFYTFEDDNGCTILDTISINQPDSLIATINTSDVSCYGGDNGTAEIVNISGGIGPYSTNWFGADTNNLSAGTYSYTITDDNGCPKNGSVNIIQPDSLIISLVTSNNITDCSNPNGSIDIDVIGGIGNYIYNWSNGETTEDLTNLSAGSYAISVSDSLGCTANYGPIILTNPSPINWTINTTNSNGYEIFCNGDSNGEIYISTSGGVGTITYNWPNLASNNDTVTNLSAGSYTVIATDSAGCTSSRTVILNQPDQIDVQESIIQLNCDTSASLFSVDLIITGGLPSYNINWFGVNNDSLTIGTYPYTITDANGCSVTDSTTLSLANPITMIDYHNDVACFGDSSATATFVVTGGIPGYTFLWSNGDTNVIATNLSAGTYYCTVTDANNCSYTDSVVISQPGSALTTNINVLNEIACFGDSVGSAEIIISGGNTPYSLEWENGVLSNTATNLVGGYNIYNITDDNGCLLIDSVFINENPEIQAIYNITNVLCYGDTTGEILINSSNVTGGLPSNYGYDLQWTSTGFGLSSTTINPLASNIISLPGFTAGTYILQFTDSLGCIKNDSIIISQPEPISVDVDSIIHVECWGEQTGYALLTISGGEKDYVFNNNIFSSSDTLSGGQINYEFTNYPAGVYTYYITDNNNCVYTDSVEILHLADSLHFTASISNYNGVNISCKGFNDGWISIDSLLGGFPPYTLSWSNGDTSTYIDSLSVGWYTANLFDSYGCLFNPSIQIVEAAFGLQSNVDTFGVSCYQNCDGIITVNNLSNFGSSSGTPPYSFEWFDDSLNLIGTNDTLNNVCYGNYSLTVTDANGCLNYETAFINQPDSIIITIDSIANVTVNGIANGAIEITSNGGNGIYSYSWYGPNAFISSNQNIYNLFAGTYFVIVTDQIGCSSDTLFITITQPPAITINVDSTQTTFSTSCYGECDANISINPVLSPNEPFTIKWLGPNGFISSNQNIDSLCAGTYYLNIETATDTNEFSFEITEPDSLDLNLFADNIDCYGGTTQVTAYTYGGILPYEFLWSNNSNNISTFLHEGTHYLTVTDANGCIAYDSIVLSQPDSMYIDNVYTSSVTCNGSSNGSIDSVSIENGNAPFIYSINQFATQQGTAAFTNLDSGYYLLEVIDSLGCSASLNVLIDSATTFTASPKNNNYADTLSCITDTCNGSVEFDFGGTTSPAQNIIEQWYNSGINYGDINGLLCPGNYSVTFTDPSGCQATINNINIYDAPTINIDVLLTQSPTCYNNANDGSIYLEAQAYYGNTIVAGWDVCYEWPSLPNPITGLTPWRTNNPIDLEPGTYIGVIIHGLHCDSPDVCRDSVAITVQPDTNIFMVGIDFDGTTLSANTSNMPTGTTATDYEWSTGENTSSITPQGNGQYWLIVTDNNGCISDTAYYNITSLNNNFIDDNLISIYPNPTNGYLFIESEENIKEVVIHNNLGEIVFTNDDYNNYNTLDLSNLTRGVYYIEININNEIVKRKIILK